MDTGNSVANIILLGPVNSGKSTVAGQLIHRFGCVDATMLKSMADEDKRLNLGGYKYVWLVDKLKRTEGLSIANCLSWKCDISSSVITLHDAPGSGHALEDRLRSRSMSFDCGILVVCGRNEEFEDTIDETRDQLLLAKAVGMCQFIVVISHMDASMQSFDKERYQTIKDTIFDFLRKIGYNPAEIPVVPVSGWYGDGIIDVSNNMPWHKGWVALKDGKQYRGQTLVQALETILQLGGSSAGNDDPSAEQGEEEVAASSEPPSKRNKLVSKDDYLDQVIDIWEAMLRSPDVLMDTNPHGWQHIVLEGESGVSCYQQLNAKLPGRVFLLSVKNLTEKPLKSSLEKAKRAVPAIILLDGLENASADVASVIENFISEIATEKRSVLLVGTKAVDTSVPATLKPSFLTIELQLV